MRTASLPGEVQVARDRDSDEELLLRARAGDVEAFRMIALYAFGDRVEPAFRGRRTMRRGKLRVEVPRGSRLDLSSMSGGVVAQRIGEVRVRTMSGDVKLAGVAKVDVQTISGDTRIEDASGPVRLHTVSGHAVVTTSGTAPQVEFQSASGSLEWAGPVRSRLSPQRGPCPPPSPRSVACGVSLTTPRLRIFVRATAD